MNSQYDSPAKSTTSWLPIHCSWQSTNASLPSGKSMKCMRLSLIGWIHIWRESASCSYQLELSVKRHSRSLWWWHSIKCIHTHCWPSRHWPHFNVTHSLHALTRHKHSIPCTLDACTVQTRCSPKYKWTSALMNTLHESRGRILWPLQTLGISFDSIAARECYKWAERPCDWVVMKLRSDLLNVLTCNMTYALGKKFQLATPNFQVFNAASVDVCTQTPGAGQWKLTTQFLSWLWKMMVGPVFSTYVYQFASHWPPNKVLNCAVIVRIVHILYILHGHLNLFMRQLSSP